MRDIYESAIRLQEPGDPYPVYDPPVPDEPVPNPEPIPSPNPEPAPNPEPFPAPPEPIPSLPPDVIF